MLILHVVLMERKGRSGREGVERVDLEGTEPMPMPIKLKPKLKLKPGLDRGVGYVDVGCWMLDVLEGEEGQEGQEWKRKRKRKKR